MKPDKKKLRKDIAARVGKHRDDLVAITQNLVRIPSVNLRILRPFLLPPVPSRVRS